MSRSLNIFLVLVVLGSHAIANVKAEEGPNSREDSGPSHDQPPPYHQSPMSDGHLDRAGFLPNFGQVFSNGSDPFGQIASAFGQFFSSFGGNNSDFPNLISAFLPHFGSRSQRIDLAPIDMAAENGTEDSTPHDRFFFSLFHHFHRPRHPSHPSPSQNDGVNIGCNYTTQAGYRCAGCREQLLCNPNNIGRLTICPSNAPYCYNGVCGTNVNSTCTNSTG